MSLLSVEDLETVFEIPDGTVKAVDGVSFEIDAGETLGVVGESGSGKSVTALSVLGLVQKPGRITNGTIDFDGRDMRALTHEQRRALLGEELSMIFQRPQESLNPVFRVGRQIAETLRIHGYSAGDPWEKAVDLLETVGIPSPAENAKRYPHEYSGGMAQRAMIAIAISRDPQLLIADEPTTALDVTIQAQILDLLSDLQADLGMSTLFISHDLGVIWEMCDRVAVMYKGRIVEIAETDELFDDPHHPYTRGLLRCLPQGGERITPIPGEVPSGTAHPSGCSFHPRCPYCFEPCPGNYPPLAGSSWVTGRPDLPVTIVLNGLEGQITVEGGTYDDVMPGWSHLTDEQIAAVLTYVRGSWGNDASPVRPEMVAAVRERVADHSGSWTVADLQDYRQRYEVPELASATAAAQDQAADGEGEQEGAGQPREGAEQGAGEEGPASG